VGLRSSMSTKAVLKLSLRLAVFVSLAAALLLASRAAAQSPATRTQTESNPQSAAPAGRLVTQAIDETRRVTLHGTVHPLAQARFDQGAVPDSFPANRMLLILNRTPDREAALQKFLADAHTPGTARFHKWLTPAQFGALYGPADSDIQTATSWLLSHGFQVSRVTAGKQFVEFSGTAANVRETFHSEIHRYAVNGDTHFATSAELAIPAALAQLIRGVSPINDFYAQPMVHDLGPASYTRSTHTATPLFTDPNGLTQVFAIAPEDFATQYDLGPTYAAGTKGAGQIIGIINRSNIDISLVDNFRSLFNLPALSPQVVIDGDDPGVIPGLIEPYLDVELAGAVAPAATVTLYIADGAAVQDPLPLAALRAIEDDQASVLSASFANCEMELGTAGNAMWYSLWEQAAAQGQTVVVATGDSGPVSCAASGTVSGATPSLALGVNGIASTPWNVAVGGTDFFYSDYASGAPSAATFWNATNDSGFGSLKSTLPEQPWSDALGLNAIPLGLSFTVPSAAGGGGPSNCIQTSPGPVCVAGYPKPSWQNAPGVPSDGVRDLPDLSLFAADGRNFSSYAICANPGDCAGATGAASTVYLVGGTSASTPALAGIMALVDQQDGRQGQANFTLYGLARQQPSLFHDITVGNNDILCVSSESPACNTPINEITDPEIMSFGVYDAGENYDLASGLGSLDVAQLVDGWNKVTFAPTTTSLAAAPASVVHGTPVTITATVLGNSSSSLPTGEVDISITSPEPLPASGALALVNGTAASTFNFFPGGTYNVTANYTGDGTFAPSASAPISLTVTPESSAVTPVVLVGQTPAGSVSVQGGQQVAFGSGWILEATPSGATSHTSGLATGTVTFTDGSTSTEVPINSSGTAAIPMPSLAIGSHSVTASYSGDASYSASTGGPLNFTVVQGTPRLILETNLEPVTENGNPVPFPTGSNLTVSVIVGTGHGVAPTGSVTVSLGSATQSAPLAPFITGNEVFGAGQVTFSNSLPGTFALSASYGGDTNWNAASISETNPIVFGGTFTATATTLSVSAASISSQSSVTLTATVQSRGGPSTFPAGLVVFYANGVNIGSAFLPTATGTSATVSKLVLGTSLPAGTSQVTAVYQGFPSQPLNLASSTSAPVSLTVTPSDFRMSLSDSQLLVVSGQSGTVNIALNGIGGSNVTVALSCAPSSAQISCGTTPSSPAAPGTAMLTVDAYSTAQLASVSARPATVRRPSPPGVRILLTLALLLALYRMPRRPLRAKLAGAGGAAILFLLLSGCGGGSGSSPPPPPQKIDAPAGTYNVVVTATSGGTIHNVKLIVVVQ